MQVLISLMHKNAQSIDLKKKFLITVFYFTLQCNVNINAVPLDFLTNIISSQKCFAFFFLNAIQRILSLFIYTFLKLIRWVSIYVIGILIFFCQRVWVKFSLTKENPFEKVKIAFADLSNVQFMINHYKNLYEDNSIDETIPG